jgi:hypothetical protein
MTPALSDTDLTALREVFHRYALAWQRNDAELILSQWDPEAFRFYKAEEIDHFFLMWPHVAAYFRHNEQFHEAVQLQFLNIDFVPASVDLVIGIVRMRWDIQFAKQAKLPDGSLFSHRGQAMGGDDHVLTMLRRAGPAWKLVGWSETPDAPISYMTRLYKVNVSPGFPPKDPS